MRRLPPGLVLGSAVALLAGCASVPPALTAASPASPSAAEGTLPPRRSLLGADELSRKTAAQLAAAQKEQQHWDAYGPVSGSPEEAPKDTPSTEMKHENH